MEAPRRVSGDETLQLGLECVAPLSPRRWIAYGFARTPRGLGSRLAVTAGPAGDCAIEHVAFHPDLAGSTDAHVRHGFTLAFVAPEERPAEAVTLTAGGATIRADLNAAGLGTDLTAATAARDWSASFRLFEACGTESALAPLLQGADFGAFAGWIAGLPALPGRAGKTGPFAEIEALASPAGDFLLVLRALAPLPASARLSMVLAARLDSAAAPPRVLALLDQRLGVQANALVLYGRVEADLRGRLQGIELLGEAEAAPGQMLRLRAHPRLVAAPDFLDAASRLAPGPGGQTGALALAGAALLRPILAAREAAFAPLVASAPLSAPWPAPPGGTPRLLAILNADDPVSARLFQVMAAAFEQRGDRLLILGEAAEEIAAIFMRRGRLSVETGPAALESLRAAPEGVVAIEAVRFAEAVIAHQPESAFTQALDGGALARLITLHGLAGFSLALDDSLARKLRLDRLAQQGRSGEAALVPLIRAWSSNLAAEMVHEHLARLWAGLPPTEQVRAEETRAEEASASA